jgi:hypothetical protein
MVKPTTKVKRTAVLLVHGMGSQRPLETARGVVDAVWLKGNQSGTGERRIWTHPEMSGVDIGLLSSQQARCKEPGAGSTFTNCIGPI